MLGLRHAHPDAITGLTRVGVKVGSQASMATRREFPKIGARRVLLHAVAEVSMGPCLYTAFKHEPLIVIGGQCHLILGLCYNSMIVGS